MRSAPSIRLLSFLTAAVLGASLVVGCSDDPSQPQDTSGSTQQNGVLQAQGLSASSTAFDIESNADDPNRPGRGRFGLRGSNLHYDTEASALVVDLTAVNRSDRSFAEPVTLTFLALLPPGTTVLNADNGETGAGAQITFAFANDDAQWTAGEESLPRTVQFGVAAGTAIAFVGRIDVGVPPGGGAIGGMVWNDADGDGLMGAEERGVGGAAVRLTAEGMEPATALTHPDGSYRFDGLASGAYTVQLRPADRFDPTTPTELTVLLTEVDGDVSDFLAANFGVMRRPVDLPPRIEPRDAVNVTGEYVPADATDPAGTVDGQKVVATSIVVHKHRGPRPLDTPPTPPDPIDPPIMTRYPGWLAGPVTAIDLEARRVEVMGASIWFPADRDTLATLPPSTGNEDAPPESGGELKLEDVKVGDRVMVRAVEIVCPACALISPIVGHGIFEWKRDDEKVVGSVTTLRAEEGPAGDQRLLSLRVLDVVVKVTKNTIVRVIWD